MPPVFRSAELAAALQDARQSSQPSERASGNNSSVNSAVVYELSVIPVDELVQRVHRFSRTNFAPAQRPLLYAHLREIMKPQRMALMPIKALQDYLQLAHVAGLHETCLEVYHAAREHAPPSTLSLHSKAPLLVGCEATLSSSNNSNGGSHDGGNGADHLSATAAKSNVSVTGLGGGVMANSVNLVVDSAVLVTSFVVDSAYAMQSSAELTRMASYCVSQLLSTFSALSSSSSSAVPAEVAAASLVLRSPQETVVEMSLVRCLWRALCLAEYYRCTEAGGVNAVRGNAEQALADAAAILAACQRVAAARREAAATLQESATVRRTSAEVPQAGTTTTQLTELLQLCVHFVRYASVGDDGEFAFFNYCKEKGILTKPQPLPPSLLGRGTFLDGRDGDRTAAAPAAATVTATTSDGASAAVYDADEVQVFYGSLIETCSAGQLVPEAMLYFTEARRLLRCGPLDDVEDSCAEVLMTAAVAAPETKVEGERPAAATVAAAVARDAFLSSPSLLPPLPSVMASRGTPAPPPPPPPVSSSTPCVADKQAGDNQLRRDGQNDLFTDFLIHRLLFTLQAAKDNRRVVRLARALIAAGVAEKNVKVNLWTLLLISAGLTRAVDVVLVAHRYAMQQLALVGGGGGGDASSAGSERRTWEYLLQTSLNALSKCQLPHFEADYLSPAREDGVLHCTDEFYFGCLLQDAHNSMNPVQRAAEVLARMADTKVPLTAPLVSRLLKLYLRAEAAEFLAVYKHAVSELHLRRVLWTDQLILWADRRRYFLTAEDRAYIVDEVLRSRNVDDVARLLPMLGGLRAQFALLHYDYTHAAREHFLADGTLPRDAPTMQDSRAHFLATRGLIVQRGVMAPVGDSWVSDASPYFASDKEALGEEVELGAVETAHYGVQPRMLGDSPRRALHVAIAALSETPLLLPGAAGQSASATAADAERLHDEALRVYLADVLGGLQRSLNSVS